MTPPKEEYPTIQLTQNQVTIVDQSQIESLSKWKWFAVWDGSIRNFYAARNSERVNGKRRGMVLMHRQLLGLGHDDRRHGDHINRNSLDNRISNLRIATNAQNVRNGGPRRNNKCGLKGVCWNKRQGKWAAKIGVDYKRKFLGYFETKESAHAAYCKAATKYHGEFARFA